MENLDFKIEQWKNLLLDLGKSNRLINFRTTKKSNIEIKLPKLNELYSAIVKEEKLLKFDYSINSINQKSSIINGDLKTNRSLNEKNNILKSLRSKAKLSIEEQGINTLYLAFGMLKWIDRENIKEVIHSPLILVPVKLTLPSINHPYEISLHDDEIVLNPSLAYKIESDFGIKLPEFNEHDDEIIVFLDKIKSIIQIHNWEIVEEVQLTLLSFLKINMYKDLDRNKERIINHPVIKAIAGDYKEISQVPAELNNYNHDKNTSPLDTYQVLDADASQQDAILLSKKGYSFVLQGPPGTGKSQTIANIISEGIADRKKILFVSEKMAALEVVKKRLSEADLDDFCLTLHSHRANKREVLKELDRILKLTVENIRDDILYDLSDLDKKIKELNEYQEQLHTKVMPLDVTIYEINGKLAKLEGIKDVVFTIDNVENIDADKLNSYKYLINQYSKAVGKNNNDIISNPWSSSNIKTLTYDLRNKIEITIKSLLPKLRKFIDLYEKTVDFTGAKFNYSINNLQVLYDVLNFCIELPPIPIHWLEAEIDELRSMSNKFVFKRKQYFDLKNQLKKIYNEDIFAISSNDIINIFENEFTEIKKHINTKRYETQKDIIINASLIDSECKEIKNTLKDSFDKGSIITQKLGLSNLETINSLLWLDDLARYILKKTNPTDKWFNEVQLNDTLILLEDAKEHQLIIKNNISAIIENYDKKIVNLNYDDYIDKLTKSYTKTLNIIAKNNNIKDIGLIDRRSILNFSQNEVPKLERCKNIIELAYKAAERLSVIIEVKDLETFDELISLSKLINIINRNPQPTISWFDINMDSVIDKIISDLEERQVEIKELTEVIISKFSNDIFNIDYKGILSRFNTEYTSFFKKIKGSYKADRKIILSCYRNQKDKLEDNDIIKLLNNIAIVKEGEQWLSDNHNLAKELLGDLYQEKYTDWELVRLNRANFKSIRSYFGNFQISDKLKKVLLNCNLSDTNAEIRNLNESILKNAITEIENITNINIVSSHPVEIIKYIDLLCKEVQIIKNDYEKIYDYKLSKDEHLTIKNIIDLLYNVRDINICRNWFQEKSYLLESYLGANFIGENTDFKIISNSITITNNIKLLLSNEVPKKFISLLISNEYPYEDLISFQWSIKKLKDSSVFDRIYSILNKKNIKEIKEEKISLLINSIDLIMNSVSLLQATYTNLESYSKENLQYEIIMSDIISLNKIQRIEEQFIKHEVELKEKYSFYYNGVGTDWERININLNLVKELKELCNEFSLSKQFITSVCTNETFVIKCKTFVENLANAKKEINEECCEFFNLFENQEELYNLNIYKLLSKIEGCTNLILLEEWISFQNIRNKCKDNDLSDFIDKIENIECESSEILNIFLKRFYNLWQDVNLTKFPAVLNFIGKNHQVLIKEFNTLDKKQLRLAQFRIREKIIAKLPDINVTTSAIEEIGILKREINKQRKIKPLRKLLSDIPNLITTLKPCLLMSPLSVSLYLQAEEYNFDIIIFDEASQIHTEDAIGAIMRGKQVIIAGDRFQLPPMSFFTANLSDTNNTDDDNDFYDSILEEAINALPERTLKWHYRSRYEDLIAFSNKNIYMNNLVTFPSNRGKLSHCGVEYIYVEEGIYTRGGRKNNIKEAKRVAELIFEHFDKFPNRSLGVVTFSETQQNAIEKEIRQRRLSNPYYEKFFIENIEEEFFIKNLENVQGDERDTIIFSIGYGKDTNGVMHMNFGPLGRKGGYRRLNVAITRAKYNLKLVGSIKPTDIDLDKTNSEGVRMLKYYIEYALKTSSNHQNDLILCNTANIDSSFEEVVYGFLVDNGYIVKTKVGCSGYRMDMAVEHPFKKGLFVLGIECDGDTYHNTRTVRERERLRRSILEDMGWTIYRIWSTDWIKNPKFEGDKLLNTIDKAISNTIL